MTTARDLLIVSMDVTTADHSVQQGELSLALAGAELLDLADAFVLTLEGDRIVPAPTAPLDLADRQLTEAAAALSRQEPYESVEDWLWRRGRGLYAAHLAALEADGGVTPQHRHWLPLRTERKAVADSPDRRAAVERWASGEPVLAALALAARLRDEPVEDLAGRAGDTVVTVVTAVDDAVTELVAVRQRRAIENAAFDNIWRGQ
ncbi:GPP34 family phosphoprotein [Streptomyces sp. ASQP_92]|uniref:GOLPH3/VPS74 family protein n=1 Tax=Streptomyces sp. ASQP_92 TaxID=2979116 RepID=UPI0021BF0A27|nr:GPP34 family phosphoprotein [Streptomyces sp. ASQP_92]MCT9090153.1 GPP34 family phosphoprotein [Streptomyces sp. ASQP_92]